MRAVGGVKVALPVLTPAALWKTSGVCVCVCVCASVCVHMHVRVLA